MVIFKDYDFEKEPCIVCGSTSFKRHCTVNGITILRCKQCGLFFVNGIKKTDLDGFYEHNYYNNPNNDSIGYIDYTTSYEADVFNYRRMLKLLERHTHGRKLLDIGCGSGFFVKLLKEEGWDAKGIDPSKYAVNYGMKKYGVDIQQAAWEWDYSSEERFDVITLIGVLEHLEHPFRSLIKINEYLNQGGLILITTLNAGHYIHLFKFKPPEHLFYFTSPQIRQLLKKAGFKILKKKFHFRTYHFSVFIHQVNSILFPWMTEYCDDFFKRFPKLDIISRFPTNEMLIIAQKE